MFCTSVNMIYGSILLIEPLSHFNYLIKSSWSALLSSKNKIPFLSLSPQHTRSLQQSPSWCSLNGIFSKSVFFSLRNSIMTNPVPPLGQVKLITMPWVWFIIYFARNTAKNSPFFVPATSSCLANFGNFPTIWFYVTFLFLFLHVLTFQLNILL